MVVVALLVSPTQAGTTYVLGADAGEQIGKLLKLQEPLSGDVAMSASVDGSSVVVLGKKAGKTVFKVSLVHPLSGEAVEKVGGGFALAKHQAPASLLEELRKRLAATDELVHWKAINDSRVPTNPPETVDERSSLDLADVFAAIEHKLTIEDQEGARRLLETMPPAIDHWARVEVAFFWKKLGDDKRVNEMVSGIGEEVTKEHVALRLAKEILQGGTIDFLAAMKGHESAACDTVLAVNLLQRFGKLDEARTIATSIRTLDPSCVPGWETEISLLLLLDKKEEAMTIAKAAQKAVPKAEGLWQVLAYLYQESGELEKAVDLLDRAVRVGKPSGGSLRNLLGTVVRNSDNRQRYLESYLKRHRADPKDTISQMIAGVILHYENRLKSPISSWRRWRMYWVILIGCTFTLR